MSLSLPGLVDQRWKWRVMVPISILVEQGRWWWRPDTTSSWHRRLCSYGSSSVTSASSALTRVAHSKHALQFGEQYIVVNRIKRGTRSSIQSAVTSSLSVACHHWKQVYSKSPANPCNVVWASTTTNRISQLPYSRRCTTTSHLIRSIPWY
jgi:hypothetical protein